MTVGIRAATPDDVPAIFALVRALAEYERLAHEVVATEPMFREQLFGPRPAAEVIVADDGGRAIAAASSGVRRPERCTATT